MTLSFINICGLHVFSATMKQTCLTLNLCGNVSIQSFKKDSLLKLWYLFFFKSAVLSQKKLRLQKLYLNLNRIKLRSFIGNSGLHYNLRQSSWKLFLENNSGCVRKIVTSDMKERLKMFLLLLKTPEGRRYPQIFTRVR